MKGVAWMKSKLHESFNYPFVVVFKATDPHWWVSNWDLVMVSPHLGQFKIVHKWAALTWFSNKYFKRYLRGHFWHLNWTVGWVNLMCLLSIFSNLNEWKQWSQVCIMPKCCDSICKVMSTLDVNVLSHSSQGIFSLIIGFGISPSISIDNYFWICNFKNVTLLFLLASLLLFGLRQIRNIFKNIHETYQSCTWFRMLADDMVFYCDKLT